MPYVVLVHVLFMSCACFVLVPSLTNMHVAIKCASPKEYFIAVPAIITSELVQDIY